MSHRYRSSSLLKTGCILIAQPFMHAPPFTRSVIYITDYSPEEGAVGFVLNKPLKMKVDRLISNFPEFKGMAMYGGPVQNDIIHYLHTYGDLLTESTKVQAGIFWGGQFEKIKVLIEKGLIESGRIRFYVGYSGWSPGQLEQEIKDGAWVVGQSDRNFIFNTPFHKLWQQAMTYQGDVYSVIAQIPDNIDSSLN